MSRYRKRQTSPARSVEPVHVRKLSAREPGDLRSALRSRPVGEGQGRTTHAYGAEESEQAVLPAKGPNKSGEPPAEDLEGRACTKENVRWLRTVRTQRRNSGVIEADERTP